MELENFLNIIVFKNSVKDILISIGIFALLLILFYSFKKVSVNRIEKISKKTKNDIDDVLIEPIKKIPFTFYAFIALFLGLKYINLSENFQKILNITLLIFITFEIILFLQHVFEHIIKNKLKKKRGYNRTAVSGITIIVKIILWSSGLLLVLSNLGINISTFIASLGIGGIAIALALQNILSDILSSFSIYFDKPFEEDDFIVIGEDMGTVKKIGIKSTRITSMSGEEIIFPNKNLTSGKIKNYKQMKKRRISFEIGLSYETDSKKLRKVPIILEEIIKNEENAEVIFSRFKSFGDFSLIFEIAYYVNSSDYNEYIKIQENINFNIKEELEKEKIEMAFPTQTLYIKK
jgi:small-conductance mechanosensitive channel